MAAKKKSAKAKSGSKPPAAKRTAPRGGTLAKKAAELRKLALAFPGTREDFPWGHSAFKVNGKAFVFMSEEGGELSLSMKLPQSAAFALMQPYASPTGYGLGKSGWVSAVFSRAEDVPVDLLGLWMEESWRAIAPKKLRK